MSKSKLHAPIRRRRKDGKKSDAKPADRAKILMNQENEDALNDTRNWLRTAESKKLQGRFTAFEDTLSKLQTTFAKPGPRYQPRQISQQEVANHVDWVDEFKGVLVKRTYLEVGKKKGKAWADQHRAKHLGTDFFVSLLDYLEQFIELYMRFTDLTREKFLYECLVAVLKKTFSPNHRQAGETPLICDQAVKTGPTRERLQNMLPSFDWSDVKKGRDVVDLLEEKLDDDFFLTRPTAPGTPPSAFAANEDDDGDNINHNNKPKMMRMDEEEMKSVFSDSSSSSESLIGHGVGTNSWSPNQQSHPTEQQLPQLNWTTFPMTSGDFLRAENERLKREVDMMRRQLVVQDLIGGYNMSSGASYNFGATASFTATIPMNGGRMELSSSDVPMIDVVPSSSSSSSEFSSGHQPFCLTPDPSY